MRHLLRDIVEWDVLNWSRALRFWEGALRAHPPENSKVLAIGERNGGLSLWLALQGYHVLCSDWHEPTPKALQLHQHHGVQERIRYARISVLQLPIPDNSFDIVISKSVIGGVKFVQKDAATRTAATQSHAIGEIRRVLKPGGSWLAAENMAGSALHRALRQKVKTGRVGWRHFEVEELQAMLTIFRERDVRFFGMVPTAFRADLLNRLSYVFNCTAGMIAPKRWRYISFISATK